uniref:Galactokinase n=1 Tax=Ascaris lumbricoides TaxID=6252 RepID=A0A0M3HT45_ASCLU
MLSAQMLNDWWLFFLKTGAVERDHQATAFQFVEMSGVASPLSFEVKNDGFCYRRKRISAYKLLAGGRATLLRDDEDTLSKKEALLERCRLSFANHFGDSNGDRMCAAVAPARVNLIGEHVDYCDGFVLPMAIPLYTMAYGRKAKDPTRGYTVVYSANMNELAKISRPYDNRESTVNTVPYFEVTCRKLENSKAIPLYTMAYGRKAKDPTRGYTVVYSANMNELAKISRPYDNRESTVSTVPYFEVTCRKLENSKDASSEPSWASYIRGVLALYPHSVDSDMVIESTIPIGGGLSSSAAVELATLFLLRQLTDLIDDDGMRREDCAVLCRRAENIFAHVPCGIMDQMVVCLADKDHALKIDCWNLITESIPLRASEDTAFLVIDCGVRHKLACSEYSNRRKSVEDALKKLDKKSWRNIQEEAIIANSCILEEAQVEHALHVVSETRRAEEAANALLDNNLLKFGQLMNESHISLRDRYRVSCAELDELVKLALSVDGVFGSRMTGGGFGGCTITMLRKEKLETLKKHISENYSGKPIFYECRPVAGVEEFPVDGVYNLV